MVDAQLFLASSFAGLIEDMIVMFSLVWIECFIRKLWGIRRILCNYDMNVRVCVFCTPHSVFCIFVRINIILFCYFIYLASSMHDTPQHSSSCDHVIHFM